MTVHSFPWSTGIRPKLQIFVENLDATGVVRNAIAIANHATANGFDVRLLVCRASGTLSELVHPGIAIIQLIDGLGARNRNGTLRRAGLVYRQHIREWRPDIMLSAGNHGHLLSCLAWLGLDGFKLLRISNDPTHGAEPSGRLKRLWRAVKFRLFASLADKLILVARPSDRSSHLSGLIRRGRATVIPNGVDRAVIRRMAGASCPHPWIGDPSVPTILAVGRHSKQKNFPTLLRAFEIARRTRPMRLLFLGDGDEASSRELRKMALMRGIADHVGFVPATPNPFPYMAKASVLSLPSLWEGSSNVLLEAMACGTPVVASRAAGDAAHVLENGRHGLLVDPLDAEELAAAILRQVGEHPVLPGDRVLQFHRDASLRRYLELLRMAIRQKSEAQRVDPARRDRVPMANAG